MRRPLLLVLLCLLAAPTTFARRRPSSHPAPFTIPELETIAAEALQAGVPGLTIAVRQGSSSVVRAWGNTRRDSVYQIGSVTKQFTAAAIMRLVEAGTVRAEDKARTWLPELDSRFDAITIEHLLTHRSGLRDYNEQLTSAWEPKTQQQILALITSGPPLFTPGSRYTYSNSGYYVLGMIIERASSKSYEQFLRETFFEPLALRDTSYCGTNAPAPDGYVIDPTGMLFEVAAADMSLPYAAGALCSTGDDLLRWTGALANGRAVSPGSYAQMIRNPGYGYALVVDTLDGNRRVWHNGAILGFQSHVAHFPEKGLTVAVLINALDLTTQDRATSIANQVARAML
ncbi:MAG TPA: serine hydrolase domain-containing protein [Thermoanaerobaculia bacterium]|nr:serine hydrolase domain-containing protein [Thermoanaerobaculia bacterium]